METLVRVGMEIGKASAGSSAHHGGSLPPAPATSSTADAKAEQVRQ